MLERERRAISLPRAEGPALDDETPADMMIVNEVGIGVTETYVSMHTFGYVSA